MNTHKFPYNWNLVDGYPAKGIDYHGSKVFSCFACGGGSTMGYKLAGYDVLGCNEIDPKMNAAYVANHNPKFNYLEPIQTFKLRKDLPKELYNLDILDGSPPCSSFSMAGRREKDWGKEKKFREGQANQVLDTLFFDFIDLAKELQPKVVIAENVEGLLLGNAKNYCIKIYKELEDAGYYVNHWLLNASKMGVPQTRKRVFFIALRKDLAEPFLQLHGLFDLRPHLSLKFNEPKIVFSEIYDGMGKQISQHAMSIWNGRNDKDRDFADTKVRLGMPYSDFGRYYTYMNEVLRTLDTKGVHGKVLFDSPKYISNTEVIKASSFPLDYNFTGSTPSYICGMSVPPVMTAQIAHQVYLQWLSKM